MKKLIAFIAFFVCAILLPFDGGAVTMESAVSNNGDIQQILDLIFPETDSLNLSCNKRDFEYPYTIAENTMNQCLKNDSGGLMSSSSYSQMK